MIRVAENNLDERLFDLFQGLANLSLADFQIRVSRITIDIFEIKEEINYRISRVLQKLNSLIARIKVVLSDFLSP